MEYTIPAIPTVYRGRRYRSRLEARWAAFFDLLGWQHEYEPCDLGTWSPDFALWGSEPEWRTLVEIKPIDHWCRVTARKISDAVNIIDPAHQAEQLLLLGSQPIFGFVGDKFQHDALGWLGSPGLYETNWTEALFMVDAFDRVDAFPNGEGFIPTTVIWGQFQRLRTCGVRPLWIEAANRVQWKAPVL